MNKLIVEEINRVREIMGLSLLTESIIPPNFWKLFLNDISALARTGAKSIDNISRIPQTADKIRQIKRLMDGINKSSDNTVKIFRESLNGVASKYNKNALDLYKNIVESKLDDAIAEEIMVLMSKKMDDTFKALLSKRLNAFNKQVEVLIFSINKISKKLDDVNLEQSVKNDLRGELGNVEILMNSLSDGPLKKSLLNQIDEITQKLSKNTDEATDNVPFNSSGRINDSDVEDFTSSLFNKKDEIPIDEFDYKKLSIYKTIKDVYPGLSYEHSEKITKEIIAKVLETVEGSLPKTKDELNNLAAELWNHPRMAPTKKDEILDSVLAEVNPRYKWYSKQGIKNYLMARDITTGKSISPMKRWLKFVKMNLILVGLTQLGDFLINHRKTDWGDMPGDSDAEKVVNLLGGLESVFKAVAPWHSGLLLLKLIDLFRNFISPDAERLFKYLGPEGVNWYSAEGDVIISKPTGQHMEDYKDYAKVDLRKADLNGNTDLGVFAYDTDTDKLIQLVTGSDGAYTYDPKNVKKDEKDKKELKAWLEKNAKDVNRPWDISKLSSFDVVVNDDGIKTGTATVGGETYTLTHNGTTWVWDK